ncbi:MAG: hypothetical protein ACRD96_18630, partial [Bryobacteraceae bacterium]
VGPRLAGERRLSEREIGVLREWAEGGAPEGDPSRMPAAPQFAGGWELGEPDAVAEVSAPFAIAAGSADLYQCFAIPLGLATGRHVRAIEFRPGNRRVVHHALVFAGAPKEASYPCFGTPGFLPSASFGGWSPGTGAIRYPEGVSMALRSGASIVMQIHYHPTGKPETDRSSVGLYFSPEPPRRRMMDIPLVSRRIDIPAGVANYRVRDYFTIPVDVDAVGIIPHAHYICRRMTGRAVLPGGRKVTLLSIRDWDFNWQEQYRYAEPVRLPSGTRVEMEFIYDNSERNPRNPSRPPKRVVWGPDSTDEMAGLHIQVIPVRPEEAGELGQALWGKLMRLVGGRF